jgi:hypothetical protein
MAPVCLVLYRLSCSIEMVRNGPKHEFWIQWNGSDASIAKNSDATLFSELCVNGTSSANLHRLSCSNETVRNAPKHKFCVQWSGSGAFIAEIFRHVFIQQTCALMAPIWPILHRHSCSNETVWNAPKHEFWV